MNNERPARPAGAGAPPPPLIGTLTGLQAGQTLDITGTLLLTADVELPDGVTLVFGPGGRLTGAHTLIGRQTRVIADEHACIFSPEVAMAGTWNARFFPLWFGAVFDGVTDCTAAIQKCLDQRGEVRLRGAGTALISASLRIYSNTWLHLDPGFTIRLADRACCPMLRTQWADQRYFSDTFPAFVTDPAFPRFKSASDSPAGWKLGSPDTNITVTGGIWDANGGNNPGNAWAWGTFDFWGCLMQIVNVDGFILRDVQLYDPCTYFFEAARLTRFCIENIHMDMRVLRPNQDGIHLEGECCNGVIQNIHGRTWDDMVALNGGDSWYPKYPKQVTPPPRGEGTNILWIPFLQGAIRQVIIRDIHVTEGLTGYRAVRLLSTLRHKMEAITIDGVYGRYAVNAVLISSHYEPTAPYGTIILRNIACEVEGEPETAAQPRQGLIHLENDRVEIDTLIVDGGSFRKTPRNAQFFRCPGVVKRLFVSNLNLTVAAGVAALGRGLFGCAGSARSLVQEACFNNVSINHEAEERGDIAIQGRWRRVKMVNCLIDTESVCDFSDYPEACVQETNNEFLCREFTRINRPC